ncbi:type II secretion system minor pseudopilin GspI [Marinobacteraceae bacterium S3BR75-40.1]
MTMSPDMTGARGFTLIEVLVALLIFGLLATTIQRTASLYFDHYERIEAKTFATWIAQNELAEMRLSDTFPSPGNSRDELTYADQDWVVETQIAVTQDATMRRVELTISKIDPTSGDAHQQLVYEGFLGEH